MNAIDIIVLIAVVVVIGALVFFFRWQIIAFLRAIDPKLVAAGVAWLLTYALTKVLPKWGVDIELNAHVIPGYITVGQTIALAAAAAAGWWKANAGTTLRSFHDDGNARIPAASRGI